MPPCPPLLGGGGVTGVPCPPRPAGAHTICQAGTHRAGALQEAEEAAGRRGQEEGRGGTRPGAGGADEEHGGLRVSPRTPRTLGVSRVISHSSPGCALHHHLRFGGESWSVPPVVQRTDTVRVLPLSLCVTPTPLSGAGIRYVSPHAEWCWGQPCPRNMSLLHPK